MALKFALSALALVNGQKVRGDVQKAYDQFLKDFGKSYDDVEKQAACFVRRVQVHWVLRHACRRGEWQGVSIYLEARFMAFAENYEYIERENAKGLSYKLGLNEFSDMSMDEFKMSKLGMLAGGSVWGDVPSGGIHKVSNASLPGSVDWRTKAVTPVKNQKQCGSCPLSESQAFMLPCHCSSRHLN